MKLGKLILILFVFSIFLFVIGCKKECDSYSTEECPNECVVCPPCAECSSISCQSEDFCDNIGFDKNWYNEISKRRQAFIKQNIDANN